MPSTRLLLVRHGQAGANGEPYNADTRLSPLGHEQAGYLTTELARGGVTTVFSSSYRRAEETANPTARQLGHALQLDDRLAEYRMAGDERKSIQEVKEELHYLMLWRPHHYGGEGGETLGQFQTRVSAFLDEVVERYVDTTVALFTHGGTIAAAMRWAYGLSPNHDWHSDVEIYNASITEIQHWPAGRHPDGAPYASAIHRLNDVRHLPLALVTEF